jgi:hypothetical protein
MMRRDRLITVKVVKALTMKTRSSINIGQRPFNSPIESGLRSLFILDAIHPSKCDLQRLVYYDYLVVHSEDVEGGPPNLHPPIPNRSGEWIVRRKIVAEGLDLMFARELIAKEFTEEGLIYSANDLTAAFLKHLNSKYAEGLRKNCMWAAEHFEKLSTKELSDFMTDNVGRWGAEFRLESASKEG